jgi:two-component system invasion response regulator UvrY
MKTITIMIVDDHTLIRQACSFSLALDPAFTVIANSGDCLEAIEIARASRPDIILLDINMPIFNGFEMIGKLRNNSPLSKIIALSAHTEIAYVKKMMRLGARGYLTKNTTMTEMVAAIIQISEGKIFLCREVKEMLTSHTMDRDDTNKEPRLTEREIEILSLLNKALSSKEIAGELHISFRTVEVHRSRILKKLKMKNTVSAVTYYNNTCVL